MKKNLFQIIFLEIHDFLRIVKVSKDAARCKRKKSRKNFRSPLLIREKVLVLAERLKKKKDAPGTLYKSTIENIPFFNRNEIFS